MTTETEILAGSRLAQLQLENQRLRRAVEELSILNDLATAIGGTNDATEIMEIIVKRSLKTVHAEQGVITLINEEHNRDPLSTFVRSMSSSSEHHAIHPDESILGWIMTYQRPLVVNDPANDPRFQGTRFDETVRSIICVPMVARSRLVGTLTIYNKKDAGGFTEADQRLVSILAAQSAQVLENARLHEEESALQQIQEELKLASQIQSKLLPQTMPQLAGYDVAGASSPARSVGGDFFDFVPAGKKQLCFWVGDVAGKGLPAALTMATIQAILRGDTAVTDEVSRILRRANRYLCDNTTRSTFVTLFLGILDAGKHELRFGNAGHNRPILLRNGDSAETLSHGDLVLGFSEDVDYSVHR
ncbi:MAG: SpoIIE family protein phosphatase, partial [Rhodothermales bacterium]|nr:SpoIIE family protein phosphatase [Rhodothermales bacterium]